MIKFWIVKHCGNANFKWRVFESVERRVVASSSWIVVVIDDALVIELIIIKWSLHW